jgi:PBSX family phage terminase large subunit
MSKKPFNLVSHLNFSEKQMQFVRHPAPYRLFGGSMGAGKSFVLCGMALIEAVRVPNNVIVVCRSTLPELKSTTMMTWTDEICVGPVLDLLIKPTAVTNKMDMWTEFKNGSRIIWTSTDQDNLSKIKSMNIGCVFIDEATDGISLDVFLMFKTRLRRKVPGVRYQICLASNPEPGWVKTIFVDRKLQPNDEPDDYAFIQALPKDNPHLPEDYKDKFKGFPEDWIRRYWEGDWTSFTGAIFTNFNEKKNCCHPFNVPHKWKHYRVIDYGYRNPFCCLWFAYSEEDEQIVVYKEHYEKEQEIPYHVDVILDNSDPAIEYEDVIDPQCVAKDRVHKAVQASIIDEIVDLSENKILPSQGARSFNGLHRVNHWFKQEKIYIIKETCPNLVNEVKNLKYRKPTARDLLSAHVPEKEVDKDNHSTDCLKYFANHFGNFAKRIGLETEKMNQIYMDVEGYWDRLKTQTEYIGYSPLS